MSWRPRDFFRYAGPTRRSWNAASVWGFRYHVSTFTGCNLRKVKNLWKAKKRTVQPQLDAIKRKNPSRTGGEQVFWANKQPTHCLRVFWKKMLSFKWHRHLPRWFLFETVGATILGRKKLIDTTKIMGRTTAFPIWYTPLHPEEYLSQNLCQVLPVVTFGGGVSFSFVSLKQGWIVTSIWVIKSSRMEEASRFDVDFRGDDDTYSWRGVPNVQKEPLPAISFEGANCWFSGGRSFLMKRSFWGPWKMWKSSLVKHWFLESRVEKVNQKTSSKRRSFFWIVDFLEKMWTIELESTRRKGEPLKTLLKKRTFFWIVDFLEKMTTQPLQVWGNSLTQNSSPEFIWNILKLNQIRVIQFVTFSSPSWRSP